MGGNSTVNQGYSSEIGGGGARRNGRSSRSVHYSQQICVSPVIGEILHAWAGSHLPLIKPSSLNSLIEEVPRVRLEDEDRACCSQLRVAHANLAPAQVCGFDAVLARTTSVQTVRCSLAELLCCQVSSSNATRAAPLHLGLALLRCGGWNREIPHVEGLSTAHAFPQVRIEALGVGPVIIAE